MSLGCILYGFFDGRTMDLSLHDVELDVVTDGAKVAPPLDDAAEEQVVPKLSVGGSGPAWRKRKLLQDLLRDMAGHHTKEVL